MAMTSIGVRTVNTTITQASLELRTTAAVKIRVVEVSFMQATGTAQSIGCGRPAAIGVTPGTTSTPVRDEPGDPVSVSTMALSWGTSPTAPTVYQRRWNSAATIGVGVIWTFPRGFGIAVSSSVVLFNITAGIAGDANIAFDE